MRCSSLLRSNWKYDRQAASELRYRFFLFNLIDFPIFNVADCYVVIACFAFVFLMLFYYKDDNDFRFLRLGQTTDSND